MEICNNKLKMYFVGILGFIIILTLSVSIASMFIKIMTLDYEILLKVLFYLFSLFCSISLSLFLRPKSCLRVDNENIVFRHGKYITLETYKSSVDSIQNVSITEKYLYETITIYFSDNSIIINSLDYSRKDYNKLKEYLKNLSL